MTAPLLTDTQLLLGDYSTVTVDILADQIVKQRTTLAYEHLQRAGGGVILVIALKVLGQVLDTHAEESYLALGATCVGRLVEEAVLFENLLLFFV